MNGIKRYDKNLASKESEVLPKRHGKNKSLNIKEQVTNHDDSIFCSDGRK